MMIAIDSVGWIDECNNDAYLVRFGLQVTTYQKFKLC